ncbi:DUF7009 family protein [Eudoraea chungangensis]|uniref:DUF7009 family protein n=1 Tax=Eudoraea chungangensis TaxID=1481905 RepID=UPI0023ED170C|nr:hypothetical protein [Eudoraea chungangensis]
MKIRIRGNSIRFRLTKTEVEKLCNKGIVEERCQFEETSFFYVVKETTEKEELFGSFENNAILLYVPSILLKNWHHNDTVGFYHSQRVKAGTILMLTLEKDFVCMDETVEDQSDNYPNPKAL